MDENKYALFFSLSSGVGPKTFIKLIKHFGNAKNAWENFNFNNAKKLGISEKIFHKFNETRNNITDIPYIHKLQKAKVKIVGYEDKLYPKGLKQLSSPPIVLYCKGNIELLNSERTIGIVGARKITAYGKDVTEELASELVLHGFTIVSGLAFGVDAVAHKTTLEKKGNTIAVLGCGVDCCTPAENEDLYEKILDTNNLIISEYALGVAPSAGSFPARNRIIAALSNGILVTEAAEDSGSLITAKEADNLGLPIFAVPGEVHSAMSKGTLKLLKNGATIVSCSEDILDKLKIKKLDKADFKNIKIKAEIKNLNKQEKLILDNLKLLPLPLDALSKRTNIPINKLLVIISKLEMRGLVKNTGGEVSIS